jgi:glucose/mannose-6-phosphate isomerase
MTFEVGLLDDEELLGRRDEGRLLWSLARAGAQVRRAAEVVAEFGVARLAAADRPRAVLLVGDAPCEGALRVLARLLAPAAPTTIWSGAELPRWAGPTDALLAASVDGRHARVTAVVAEAARRGVEVCAVAPARSPLAQAARRAPVADLSAGENHRSLMWAVLTPLLQAADALQLHPLLDGQLAELADALDLVAETCRPASDAFTNPAKALAVELAEAFPVVAGAGPLASVAARLVADAFAQLAGSPAVSISLPDGASTGIAILSRGAPDDGDFFRDRIDVAATMRPRLIVIGDEGDPDDLSAAERTVAESQLDDAAARRAGAVLSDVARGAGVRVSMVDVPAGTALTRLAAAHAFGMFTATYLALGQGIDPSAPRFGELGHL